jgi:hypothetical protein
MARLLNRERLPALAYARRGFLSSAIAGASHDGLTPTAVTVIAAAAKQKDKHNDDQQEFHNFLQR